jgi:2-oxoacid:acceptor oxidoreductase gamma subunit (pyruvate/2-ketoisovalerate family)/2-oxoacid:acceptor oxidoreductase delta subunit (pyruvate/2-ketoisovalerate family)
LEIRVHGRGGQGGVTCAKILAGVYARLGQSVQTFGDYAGERSGAPVRAYLRVSDDEVTNRNKVYHPDHLLVLDPTLLGTGVMDGLAEGGTLLLNTPEPPEAYAGRYDDHRLVTVDATAIARRHGIGSRSLVIVNTTIAGAFIRAFDLPIEELEATYREFGFHGNFAAAREAYESAQVREAVIAPAAEPAVNTGTVSTSAAGPAVIPLTEHTTGLEPLLKTGSWRTQHPRYVMHLAPCSGYCPAGNDVIGFVQALGKQGEESAAQILGQTTSLSAVCGRVCPAPCMEACNRDGKDGPVNVRGLERWVADRAPVAVPEAIDNPDPRRIAIVGGGPAGLNAAYVLGRLGHEVTIYEGESELGGLLRTGIPSFRLSREVLDKEILDILSLGVEVRCGEFIDTERIVSLAQEYDGLILATGLQRLRGLDVPGSDKDGVAQGIGFLHRVNVAGDAEIAGDVVILGGGNTALDCARSALRTGASSATVAYRRTRIEMPAIEEEIDEAEDEGVRFMFQQQPVAFGGNGRLDSIQLAEVEMGEPDDSGRRSPVVTDRTSTLPCDNVLLAIGQYADLSLLPEGWDLEDGRVVANGEPLSVFAAGDLSTNDGTVAHAIGDGNRAATRLLAALGEQVEVFERPDRTCAVAPAAMRADHFEAREQTRDRITAPEERVLDFREVNRGIDDPSEAFRCFSCGSCTHCDTCLVYCPEGIIHRSDTGMYEIDLDYCKGCGICVAECPRDAMEMVQG